MSKLSLTLNAQTPESAIPCDCKGIEENVTRHGVIKYAERIGGKVLIDNKGKMWIFGNLGTIGGDCNSFQFYKDSVGCRL